VLSQNAGCDAAFEGEFDLLRIGVLVVLFDVRGNLLSARSAAYFELLYRLADERDVTAAVDRL